MSDVQHWGDVIEMAAMERRIENQRDTIDRYHERWHHYAAVTDRNHVLTEQLDRAQTELRRMREVMFS